MKSGLEGLGGRPVPKFPLHSSPGVRCKATIMGWRILKCSVLCWKCENLLHTSTCACFCVAHVNLPKQRMRQFFCYCNLQLNDGTLLLILPVWPFPMLNVPLLRS